jgi:hypothetical protein
MFLGNLSHLHALKGVGNRAFYRRLTRDYRALFPRLPERTRLFRPFTVDGNQLCDLGHGT